MMSARRARNKALVSAHLHTAPGLSVDIVRMLAEGDLVAVYSRQRPEADPGAELAAVDIVRVRPDGMMRRWRVARRLDVESTRSRGPFDGLASIDAPTGERRHNRIIVLRMQRLLFEQHRVDEAVDRYFDPDRYLQHAPGALDGAEFIRERFRRRFADNPQARSTLLHIVAEGDLVLTHRWSRIAPGAPSRRVCDIFRVENGRIVEHWDVSQTGSGDLNPKRRGGSSADSGDHMSPRLIALIRRPPSR